jgi:predicted nucleic acid-binding protein
MPDVAVDSSTLISYLNGREGKDVTLLKILLQEKSAFLPPVTVSETLSSPSVTADMVEAVCSFPILTIEENYWRRVGETRRVLLAHKLKAHLPDALIAQSCIDHEVPLLTRDPDFAHYAKHCGLKLVME